MLGATREEDHCTTRQPPLLSSDARSQLLRLWLAAGLALLLLTPETTFAREPSSTSARVAAPAGSPAPGASSHASAAASTLIIACLTAGAATTLYGLSATCAEHDASCRRQSSLAIWGGVGIASLGSAIGLAVARVSDPAPARGAQLGSMTSVSVFGSFE